MLIALDARAHVADEIVVRLDEQTLTETVTMTAETLAMLAPVDADGDGELTQGDLDARADAIRVGVWDQAKLEPCTRSTERASLEPGYVALTARFTCGPGELTQDFRWLMVLPSNYRVIFGGQVARGDQRTLHVAWERGLMGGVGKGGRAQVEPWRLLACGVLGGLVAVAVGFWLVRRLRQ